MRETHLDSVSTPARPLSHGWGSECHVVFISGLCIATPPCRTWPDRRWGQAQTESAWAGELGWGLLELPAVRSEAHTGPSGYFFQLALAQETPAWRSPDRSMSLPLAGLVQHDPPSTVLYPVVKQHFLKRLPGTVAYHLSRRLMGWFCHTQHPCSTLS